MNKCLTSDTSAKSTKMLSELSSTYVQWLKKMFQCLLDLKDQIGGIC